MKKKLIGFALIVGAVAAAAKLVASKKAQWKGLGETEVRQKVEELLPGRVSEQKRVAVADRVVSTMREAGVLEEDPTEQVPDTGSEADSDAVQDDAGKPEATTTDS